MNLDAVDTQRLPKGLLDSKICSDYRVVVLSKRNNRLIVATADPSDQSAAEKIKFSTQMGVDWVIAEYDKLSALVEATNTTAAEAMEDIIGGDFEFDESAVESAVESENTEWCGGGRRAGGAVFAQDADGCVQHAGVGLAF
jgi:type IV pilus assembly protein PilB